MYKQGAGFGKFRCKFPPTGAHRNNFAAILRRQGNEMAKGNGSGDTVVIKKYANRRLYDTSTSSYVTLDHLAELVRKEVNFEVRDAKTGEDLTRAVLHGVQARNAEFSEATLTGVRGLEMALPTP